MLIKSKILTALLSVVLSFQLAACDVLGISDHTNESDDSSSHITSAPVQLPDETDFSSKTEPFELSMAGEYTGAAVITINDNIPYFSSSDLTTESYEKYSPLDELGRCGTAQSCIGKDIMPKEKRGAIGMVKPSGWHLVKYQGIDGNYLYNRCHLIAYQLTGENANGQNLITGTRYMNTEGMLPLENKVAEYIKSTGNHVMYRVSPVFDGNDLLCRGVLMEGYSVEDEGRGVCFCCFAYNVQPGVTIDYSDGASSGPEFDEDTTKETKKTGRSEKDESTSEITLREDTTYVFNKSSHKFHLPGCDSVKDIRPGNLEEFSGTRDEAIEKGYKPCKRCEP